MVNIHEDERSLATTDARGYQEKGKAEKDMSDGKMQFYYCLLQKKLLQEVGHRQDNA